MGGFSWVLLSEVVNKFCDALGEFVCDDPFLVLVIFWLRIES